jgi:hypothetical protein
MQLVYTKIWYFHVILSVVYNVCDEFQCPSLCHKKYIVSAVFYITHLMQKSQQVHPSE